MLYDIKPPRRAERRRVVVSAPPTPAVGSIRRIITVCLIISVSGLLSWFNFYPDKAKADIASGLVAHWAFDDGTGTTAADSSGNNLTGNLSGSTVWDEGHVGTNSILLDGSTQSVNMGNSPLIQLTGEMTLSAWFKGQSNSINEIGINKLGSSRGYELGVRNNGAVVGTIARDSSTFLSITATGHDSTSWTLYTFVYKPSQYMRLYRNGLLIAENTTNIPAAQYSASNNLLIGLRPGSSNYFAGNIDDVRIYSRALSTEDIASLYQLGDTISPVISSVVSSTNLDSATIGWTTDEASTSQIEYGLTTSYGNSTVLDTNPVTSHSLSITDLSPGVTYHYRVKSSDGAGNESIGSDQIFIPQARDFYVSTTGSDSNDGSFGTPFLTLNYALSKAYKGDTIHMAVGTYSANASTIADGTNTNRITISGAGMSSTIITGRLTVNKAYYTITGIKFSGNYMVLSSSGAHDNLIDGNEFTAGQHGIDFSGSETNDGTTGPSSNIISNNEFHNGTANAMIDMLGHDNLIASNIFRDNDGWDVFRIWGRNQMIRGNQFLRIGADPDNEDGGGNHADIMQTFDTTDNFVSKGIVFENNLIEDGTSQLGNLENGGPADISDWTIRNNVFVNSRIQINIYIPEVKVYNNTVYSSPATWSSGFRFGFAGTGSGDDGQVYNNIFIGDGAFYSFNANTTGGMTDYNLIAASNGSARTLTTPEPHGINGGVTAADIFVDPDNGDFHLKAGSPAIDSATTIASFSTDKDGTTRPQLSAWDIGAYEYAPDGEEGDDDDPTPPPPAPTPPPTPTPPPVPIPPTPNSVRSLTPIPTVIPNDETPNTPADQPGSPLPDPFLNYLRYGMTSLEVKKLQEFLNQDPDTSLGKDGPGSKGRETTFFGPRTLSAVKRFQQKYLQDILSPWGLTKGTGFVGKTTLQKINRMIGRG